MLIKKSLISLLLDAVCTQAASYMHVYTCKSVKYVKYMYIHLKILFFKPCMCICETCFPKNPDTGIHVYVPLSNIIKKEMMGCKKSEGKISKTTHNKI